MAKKSFYFLVVAVAIVSWSCYIFDHQKNILTEAEITRIESHSDTSVLVKVSILIKSNAETCDLKLFWYTLHPDSTVDDANHLIIGKPLSCAYEKNYNLIAGGMIRNKKYYFQLYNSGTFDIGGPNQSLYKMGTLTEYTMP
jgi:hypothetical protein